MRPLRRTVFDCHPAHANLIMYSCHKSLPWLCVLLCCAAACCCFGCAQTISADELVGAYSATIQSLQHLRKQQWIGGRLDAAHPHIVLDPDGTFEATDFPLQDSLRSLHLAQGRGTWKLVPWDSQQKLHLRFVGDQGVLLDFEKKRRSVVVYVYLGDPDSGDRLDLESKTSDDTQ